MPHEYATYSSSLLYICLEKRMQAIQNHTVHYSVRECFIRHGIYLKLKIWLEMQIVCFDSMSFYLRGHLLYILESNPHPFYSFRGLNIRCGLQSRAD
jgi:hypothetical protein